MKEKAKKAKSKCSSVRSEISPMDLDEETGQITSEKTGFEPLEKNAAQFNETQEWLAHLRNQYWAWP